MFLGLKGRFGLVIITGESIPTAQNLLCKADTEFPGETPEQGV